MPSWPEDELPGLNDGNCEVTSPPTPEYNCLAWTAGEDQQWWDPNPLYYWPEGVPREATLDAFEQIYGKLGFRRCADGAPEAGFEKIGIFARKSGARIVATHAARLLPSGAWTSKLGPLEDITHQQIENVSGPVYGEVAFFMSKRIA